MLIFTYVIGAVFGHAHIGSTARYANHRTVAISFKQMREK